MRYAANRTAKHAECLCANGKSFAAFERDGFADHGLLCVAYIAAIQDCSAKNSPGSDFTRMGTSH
jgi:hypothetical protein